GAEKVCAGSDGLPGEASAREHRIRTGSRRKDQRPGKNDGSGRSRIVWRPGAAPRTFAMELTTIDAVATSPWMPPASFIDRLGDPSISTESNVSGDPRYASMCSLMAGSPLR